MCMVRLYVTITVVFLNLMCTVKLYIVIIHYYTYIGSRKEEYFNGSKWINKNGALKRSRTRWYMAKLIRQSNANGKDLHHNDGRGF